LWPVASNHQVFVSGLNPDDLDIACREKPDELRPMGQLLDGCQAFTVGHWLAAHDDVVGPSRPGECGEDA
jgi:hypothetical protein